MIYPTDLSYIVSITASNEMTKPGKFVKRSIFSKSLSIPSTSQNIANGHNPFINQMLSKKDETDLSKINLDARVVKRIINGPDGLEPGYLRAVNEIALALQSQFDSNELTSGFPVRELYRLFIDRKDWQSEHVFFAYEDEPGYTKAMLSAFLEMKSILSDGALDLEKITKIHDLCIQGVSDKNGQPLPNSNCVDFCSVSLFFNNTGDSNCTKKGFREITELAKDKKGIEIFNYMPLIDETYTEIDGEVNPVQLDYYQSGESINIGSVYHNIPANRENIKTYCDKFNKQIFIIKTTCNSEEVIQRKIITTIAEVCRNIQVTHPFQDGNARTIGCLLVNGLLMAEGMSPAIIPDANSFDGHSVDELVEIIKEGQQQFQGLRRRPRLGDPV
ncbi:hypothetical protein [Endozoicomonas sp. YOMI1]|uniref:hypothetical protein n=1 Tax=Endozoicomonas sp. YOMI1 TaxID=2828739 RepID=UPI0021490742|nr:hypothetical protein [Endozoicomonas sp. YOMI1]